MKHTRGFPLGLHSVVAIAVSLVLVAVDAGIAPSAQAQARARAKEARDLPALTSAAAPRKAVEVPGGDFSNPPLLSASDPRPTPKPKAPSFDRARSTPVEAETSPTRKVFANPDGTRTAELTTRPVRFKEPTGVWRDIDLSLAVSPDGTSAPRASYSVVRFGAKADGAVATLTTPAGPVVLRHPGAASVVGAIDKDRSTYAKALSGGRDLVLAAVADGFKESVILPGASAPASYTEELVLPHGLTARQAPGGVELIDTAGAVVATYANGTAHDAAFPVNGTAGLSSVAVTLAKAEALVATIVVSIDPAWLAAPGRAFPVTVDPTLVTTTATTQGGQDTWVQNGANINTVLGASPYLFAGTSDGGTTRNRTLVSFDLGTAPAPDVVVTASTLTMWNYYSTACNPAPVILQGAGAAWSQATTTWNNQPIEDAASPITSGPTTSLGATGCAAGYANYDVTGQAQRWMDTSSPNYGLVVKAPEIDSAAIRGWYSAEAGYSVALTVTYDHLPGPAAPMAPANGAVIATTTPQLEVDAATDPDGDVVRYWYTVSTSADASVGQRVVWSGWVGGGPPYENPGGNANGTSYAVPAGALQDGVTYYWGVSTWDGVGPNTSRPPPAASLRRFTVNLGQGAQGERPRDAVGAMGVDLISGNLSTDHASPTFATVGGPVGVSYAYNSAGARAATATAGPGRTAGLRGTYYNDVDPNRPVNGVGVAMSRRDSNLAFLWAGDGYESPAPGLVNPDNFLVSWTGAITLPKTSTAWRLWTANDGRVRIWVNNVKILDAWSADHYAWPEYSSPFAATANVPLSITVEYYEATGAGMLALGANGPLNGDNTFKEVIVPPTWLSTEAGPLPAGWSLGVGDLAYESLRLGEDAAVAGDPTGGSHVYASHGASGYSPPPDGDAILAGDAGGSPTLHGEDGLAYVFDHAGQLMAATAATDDANQSSPNYSWSSFENKPRRLTRVTDPVSGRFITLRYAGLDAALACPSPPGGSGFAPAPAFQLCQVDYWDGTDTKLWYTAACGDPTSANCQVARIEDPGGAITDFAYNAERLLASLRDPLAADAIAATATTFVPDNDTARTVVTYDTAGRASHVSLPVPYDGISATVRPRPGRGYEYSSTAAETLVHVDGLTGANEPNGYHRKVTYDAAGRMTATVDATAKTTSFTWDAGDRLTASTDAASRRSTTIYDGDVARAQRTGRPTATHGPAPASCFASSGVPNGSCAAMPPPHTATTYDAEPGSGADPGPALTGLALTAWDNTSRSGPPKLRTEAPTTGGVLVAGDLAGLPPGAWSARYTGEVNLASADGTYGFAVAATGNAARLYVDDRLVIDTAVGASATMANTFAGRHRIRLDVSVTGASPNVTLSWTPPSSSSQPLGAANLAPRYSLPTHSATDDTTGGATPRTSDALYPSMATGLITDATADRALLNIVTSTAYEPAGVGYLRPVSRTLGAGAGTATAYAYYQPADAVPANCPGAAADQGRALKSTTGATPAAGAALVRNFTYDAAGRTVGSATAGAWTCRTYDARGRVTSVTVPAYGGEPAHTFTANYAVGSAPNTNPLLTSLSEGAATITTRTDLLGRVISYTDTWNKTTTSTYDQAGRRTGTIGPAGDIQVTHDPAGRVLTQSLDGALMATASYDTAGELATVSYAAALNGGNGTSLSAITRHPTGMTTGLTWTGPAGTLATDAVTRSQSGRVVDETIDGIDADASNPNFVYDSVGRLTKARVAIGGATHVLDYAFADHTPNCPQAAPGRNSNRSSLTDTVAALRPPPPTATTTPTGWCRAPIPPPAPRPMTATATPPPWAPRPWSTTVPTATWRPRSTARPSSVTSATPPGASPPGWRGPPPPATASPGPATRPASSWTPPAPSSSAQSPW